MNKFDYFKNAILLKYSQFDGRSRRAEFWYFTLFSILISIALSILDTAIGLDIEGSNYGVLELLYSLAIFIPSLALSVRRLHDVGKSGWNLLWSLSIIGILYVLYLYIKEGDTGQNEYGSDPKNETTEMEDHLVSE